MIAGAGTIDKANTIDTAVGCVPDAPMGVTDGGIGIVEEAAHV